MLSTRAFFPQGGTVLFTHRPPGCAMVAVFHSQGCRSIVGPAAPSALYQRLLRLTFDRLGGGPPARFHPVWAYVNQTGCARRSDFGLALRPGPGDAWRLRFHFRNQLDSLDAITVRTQLEMLQLLHLAATGCTQAELAAAELTPAADWVDARFTAPVASPTGILLP